MGSPCELQLYAKDQTQFEHVAQNVVKDLVRLEDKYSRYRADSFLSKINQCATQGKSIEVDAETAHLLNYAQTCYQQSDGLFDITSGRCDGFGHLIRISQRCPSKKTLMQF
jgi:thiamine biosynthesis lipoprotein